VAREESTYRVLDFGLTVPAAGCARQGCDGMAVWAVTIRTTD
jgi:hypothetical protein